jgi:hypothetical protein
LFSLTGFPESGCKGTKFLRNCKQKRKKSCDFNNYFVLHPVYLSKSRDYTLLYICARENNHNPDSPPRRREEEARKKPTPDPSLREERRKEERKKKKNA